MKLIFLDIDGVLNGWHWYKHPFRKFLMKIFKLKSSNNVTLLCPFNVRWLKKLVKKYPTAKIVMSSSWRQVWSKELDAQKYLNKQGIEIWSATPVGSCQVDPDVKINWDICTSLLNNVANMFDDSKEWTEERRKDHFLKWARGSQILTWFKDHNLNIAETDFVILEDDYKDVCCFDCLKDHTVITSFYDKKFGFRKKHYKEALKILK